MPTFELTSPWGQKYRVNAPEGATQEQAYDVLKQHLSQTQDNPIGQAAAVDRDRNQKGLTGMAARGLTGVAQGFGEMAASGGEMLGLKPGATFQTEEKAPIGATEQFGRAIGRAGVPVPGGPAVQGAIGGVEGALQPADSWTDRAKNAAIGAGSASGLSGLARRLSPSAANHLLGTAFGAATGYGHGALETMFGAGLGERLGGYVPLGRIARWVAMHYPGAAAETGIGGAKIGEHVLDDQQRSQ